MNPPRAEEQRLPPEPTRQAAGVPLVLCRVPALRRPLVQSMAGPPETLPDDEWWELVDAAAPPGQPPAGIAVTRSGPGDVTHVLTVSVADPRDDDLPGHVVRELVAALRRTRTQAISVPAGHRAVDAALLAEDFVLRPGTGPSSGDVFVLTL